MKNNINKRKFEITVLFLTLLFIAMMKIVTMTAPVVLAEDGASSVPSLFYNDAAFMYDDILPLQQINGLFYVPIELIKLLNDIKMDSKDKFTENFYIQYRNLNWIAFKVSADRADTIDRENITCKVYMLKGTTYVPAQLVADSLGLTCEYNSKYNSFRMREDGAKRDFDDLLAVYIKKPITVPTETTTSPPPTTTAPATEITTPGVITQVTTPGEIVTTVKAEEIPFVRPTEPITTAEPTTPEDTREIKNYLLFYDSAVSYGYYGDEGTEENREFSDAGNSKNNKMDKINEVLRILDKNNMRAVFFLSGSEITENPHILRKIYSSGHEVGIKTESGKINFDYEDLLSELENANALIYSAVKHKTRIYMFDESEESVKSDENLIEIYESRLAEKGYYLCKKTEDITGLGEVSNSTEMIDFVKQKKLNVFMFDLNGSYRNYLEMYARASEIKFYIKFSYINNANIENIKEQIIESR